jgi:DNA ligase-associated metallophosphoesterase
MRAEIAGSCFELLAEKAIHWKEQNVLLVADLHLGKINHFRKSGYPVPVSANDVNTTVLIDLLNKFRPQRMIFLGDLFHSHYNEEWEVLGQIIRHFQTCSFELVMGNHDIMSSLQYERHQVHVHKASLEIDNIVFTHEPMLEVPERKYNLSGHIHPGAKLYGKGRQALTLPCFYFGKSKGILPAFGSFTGLYPLQPKKGDRVFVIAEGNVIEVRDEQ